MFGHGNAKGICEYSSTTVSMYAFRDVVGSGPLKSILSRSIACVDFINVPGSWTIELLFYLSTDSAYGTSFLDIFY